LETTAEFQYCETTLSRVDENVSSVETFTTKLKLCQQTKVTEFLQRNGKYHCNECTLPGVTFL